LKYPRCCEKEPEYLITYDCGSEENQTILVCHDHYLDEPFRRFILKIEKLKQ
jgi:hypothetical protein